VRRIRSAEAFALPLARDDFLENHGKTAEADDPALSKDASREGIARQRKRITVVASAPVEKAEQHLATAFANFLAATATSDTFDAPRRGSRSLSGICLRKIPQLLETEAVRFDIDQAEGALDESSNLYSYIEEEFENVLGQGSPYLRQVVRSHGAELVRKAVLEGLLSDKAIRDLIDICHERDAAVEGGSIVETWLNASADFSGSHSDALRRYCNMQQSNDIFFRILRQSLADDLWRTAQITRKHEKLCSAIPTGLDSRNVGTRFAVDRDGGQDTSPRLHEAEIFLEDCVSIATSADYSFTDNTHTLDLVRDLNSTAMITTLLALGDALETKMVAWRGGIASDTVLRVAARLLVDSTADAIGAKRTSSLAANDVAISYLISAFLILATRKQSHFGVITLEVLAAEILTPANRERSLNARLTMRATRFIYQFVKSVTAFDLMTGNNLGSMLLRRLSEMSDCQTPEVSILLRALASEIAMRCPSESGRGQQTCSTNITPKLRYTSEEQKENIDATQSMDSSNCRWEDGISEWITATPKPGNSKDCSRKDLASRSGLSQAGMSSPDALALSPVMTKHKRASLGHKGLPSISVKSRKALQLIQRQASRRRRTADELCSGDELE
jgi:hypothetical protein